MSSQEYATLSLEIFPSRTLLSSSHVAHLLGLSAIALTSFPDVAKAVLLTVLCLSWIWIQTRYGFANGRWFIRRIEWSGGEPWSLHSGSGSVATAALVGGFIHPQVLILNFSIARASRRSVVIFPDAGDPDVIRRLRLRLLALDHFPLLIGQCGSDSRAA
jgi:hypothetical protein